jgi:hypothetical protein
MWEPEEWGQAADYYKQLTSGQYTNPALQQGLQFLTNVVQSGGSPVDTDAWGQAQRAALMRQYEDATKEMMEKAGVGGVRYGSGLQQSIGKYGSDLMSQFGAALADKWLQAQEAAKQRQMQAGMGYLPYGQLGITGAEGLQNLGTQRATLPLQVASYLGNIGQQLTGQQVDPWTQFMAQMLGEPTFTEQTYRPSIWSNILGGLGTAVSQGLFNQQANPSDIMTILGLAGGAGL